MYTFKRSVPPLGAQSNLAVSGVFQPTSAKRLDAGTMAPLYLQGSKYKVKAP